ncbi:hypothetical protein CTI14_22660, partial [Methylobacterium radiotolerans]
MKEDFAKHRDNARAAGLPVNGMIIGRPVSLIPVCPTSRDDPYWDEWQEHLDRIELYNEIAADVGSWWGELEVWISENLDGFLGTMPSQSTADKILSGLREASGEVPKIYLEGQGLAWAETAAELTSHAEDLRLGASDFVRELRSAIPPSRPLPRPPTPP